ncbi:histone deacetylase clr3 [Guyanagaster necrorhizus]|uniref:histone deacetylase n=1 Tax=Guyanagaster necrorhizus TaxID=856835 RepID=A0A9P8AVY9_9AGAR|nr:histone deacetylase clr3 [Guyanagaster necrorhizus MCA 3950]KAG7449601.1 histone deacetylase clr3 [Guyanagaster necrorhizus MCA 3950]
MDKTNGNAVRATSAPLDDVVRPHVAVIYSSEMTCHRPLLEDHFEQPARITRIWETITAAGCTLKMKRIPIRPAHKNEVLLVHSEDHWVRVQALRELTDEKIQETHSYYDSLSLYVMQGTTRAALLSCGGVIEACLAVASDLSEIKKCFAIVRPPGHHAEPTKHMGFCFFNNVAVAIKSVQQQTTIKRVMVLDWDVHHGNGTQRAFNDDPTVLYVSLHRYDNGGFYPCGPFGGIQSCGEGPGLGFSVNIPWPGEGMGDAEYIHAFQHIVMPIAMEFAPQLVIISAGFDAAQGDPLGQCCITPAGYAHMTYMLSGLAGGRLVVALEGGYNVEAGARSALAVTKVIVGEPPDELPPMTASEQAAEAVWLVAKEQSKYWRNVNPKACEPREDVQISTFSIPEILKSHRQNYLSNNHHMMNVPLVNEEMEERFGMQIMCTPDILDNPTVVFFMHDFGDLQAELENFATCNLDLERSYLVDFSKELISWVKAAAGHCLLDVNLYPKPLIAPMKKSKSAQVLAKELIIYLWDNYVQLSNAQRVILIGHGPGCQPMIDLLQQRWSSVSTKVKGIVQVVGHLNVPLVPTHPDEIIPWYLKHSFVAVPVNHQVLAAKTKKRHGNVVPINETRAIKLLTDALPSIEIFIQAQLRAWDQYMDTS